VQPSWVLLHARRESSRDSRLTRTWQAGAATGSTPGPGPGERPDPARVPDGTQLSTGRKVGAPGLESAAAAGLHGRRSPRVAQKSAESPGDAEERHRPEPLPDSFRSELLLDILNWKLC
jgi:hypothetical protein